MSSCWMSGFKYHLPVRQVLQPTWPELQGVVLLTQHVPLESWRCGSPDIFGSELLIFASKPRPFPVLVSRASDLPWPGATVPLSGLCT